MMPNFCGIGIFFPALRVGLALFIGILSAYYYYALLFVLLFRSKKMCLVAVLAFFWMLIMLPSSLEEGEVIGRFTPGKQELTSRGAFFKGNLKGRHYPKGVFFSIPVSFYLPSTFGEIQEGKELLVKGILYENRLGNFYLKVKEPPIWADVSESARFRFSLDRFKKGLSDILLEPFQDERVRHFFSGVFFGDFPSNALFQAFSRLGIAHILAISGFHFALFISILTRLFPKRFSKRGTSFCLVLILFSYALLIGKTPSLFRAFIMAGLMLIGGAFSCRPPLEHVFGLALFCSLLFDPFFAYTLGFQFSFAITGALIFFYPYMEKIVLKKRIKNSYLLKLLAVNMAVWMAYFPLAAIHFGGFSLIGIAYNFFFPFITGILMTACLIAFALVFFIPPIGLIFLSFIEKGTLFMLHLVLDFPPRWELWLDCAPGVLESVCLILGMFLFFEHAVQKTRKALG